MARPAVLVATPFLLERRALWADGYDLVEPRDLDASGIASTIEALVCSGDALDSGLVNALPNLELVACFSTGYAGIDLAHLRSRGIALTSAAGVNAHDVADHAIALLLAAWHGVVPADRSVRAGRWRDGLPPRPSLRGKRAGIVGLGRIGLEIARRVEALGLSVRWWGPRAKPGVRYERAPSLVDLARGSDVLLVASRAIPANARQIDREVLAALGPKGWLVNVSRGLLVDEQALVEALTTRGIAGAGLDVFADEPPDARVFGRFDNVVLSPHIAGYTAEAGAAMFGQLRENLRRHFAGEPLLTPVEDAPA
ncbi:MAG TPA: NAD(P)-dependent oxidoreductase [Gammaproteobacteria bacterium]|jgi:lactate dehydrogenase-like 2-hydroxyacid dehydrogenase|nr:NAD(P)-dependent oxidoreductase [Gammaproteobacteria bacterium]